MADVGPVDPPASAPPSIPQVAGSFSGRWQGRPIVIHLDQRSGGALAGRIEVNQGVGVRIIALTGRVEASGDLRLSEPNEGWMMTGKFQNGVMSGLIMQDGMRKPASFSVSRQ